MGKAALGKGMKDLLAKNFGLEEEEGPEKDKEKAQDELQVNIERYQAQGLNVEPLKKLRGKDPKKVSKGIEDYREAVKVMISAQTVLRSLEGYGYNKEVEAINEHIKDPSRAEQVLTAVEELRDRAHTEHDTAASKKGSPGRKLSKSLKEKSEKLKGNGSKQEASIEIDESALDGLLDDLDEIGDAFSIEIETDPLLSRISQWEEMGYFVDKLKNSAAEDRDRAEKEADQFEKDVKRMEKVKETFNEMDLTGFQQEAQELMLKFQYPHLAKDVENELKRIIDIQKNADSLLEEKETPGKTEKEDEAPAGEESETEMEPEGKTEIEAPPEEEKSREPEVEPPQEEVKPPEEEDAPETPPAEEAEEELPEEEKTEPTHVESDLSGHTPDEIMEMAKDAYKEGRMEEALTLFKELLKKDPDSSKARFMIRRISSKLGE
jgi:hypothetical protein